MAPQILVPLDGSARAEAIVPHAVALARATGSMLTLIRVITPIEASQTLLWIATAPAEVRAQWEATTLARAGTYLQEVAERLQEAGLTAQTEVLRAEDVAAAIVARAQRDPDVTHIAMTTHGWSGLQRWMLGSIAQTVLATATTPLLLLRAHDEALTLQADVAFRTMVVPLDGSAVAAQALTAVQSIAAATQATIILVSAVPAIGDPGLAEAGIEPYWMLAEAEAEVDTISRYLQQITDQLESRGMAVRTKLVTGAPADAILRVCGEEHADLLVMATHGRSGVRRLLLGSVAAQVLQRAVVPLLLIRAQAQQVSVGTAPASVGHTLVR